MNPIQDKIERIERIERSLNSLEDRLRYAQFHLLQIEEVFRQHVERPNAQNKPLRILSGVSIPEKELLANFRLVASAHLVACIQDLHSLGDIAAYSIYFCFGGEIGHPYAEHQITVKKILEWFENREDVEGLKSILRRVTVDDPLYGHLDALCNHGKHRSLIRHGISFHMGGGDNPYSLQIESFDYKNRHYSSVSAFDFLHKQIAHFEQIYTELMVALEAE